MRPLASKRLECASVSIGTAMSVTVPVGLSELLEEFAVSVLREKPADLVEFAARYFNNLHSSREQEGKQQTAAVVPELADTAEVEMDAEGDLQALCLPLWQ